jgi:hypothetical protein
MLQGMPRNPRPSWPIKPPDSAWVRPPILHATAALGLSDAEVARHADVHSVTVNQWAHGIRPIPPLRHSELQVLVAHILQGLRKMTREDEREDRRRDMTLEVAEMWLRLSVEEAVGTKADPGYAVTKQGKT